VTANSALPEPDSLGLAHSSRLVDLIKQRISSAGGLISFADFMTHALYEPGLGYYMAGAPKFGSEGDFVTAPEITPLFGAALAVQRELLAAALSPAQFDRVNWISALPEDFIGVMLANEVMDALPVERFTVTNSPDRTLQLFVSDEFQTVARMSEVALSDAVTAIESDLSEPFAPGYESEVCLLLKPWVNSLAKSMNKGVLLLIDYGYPRSEYYLPERTRGTLACYYRHRAHDDPFQWPGLQDITAHVDFTGVAEAAALADLELLGYATQSAFLLDNDLLLLAEALGEQLNSDADRIAVARAVKTLTLPGEMGERFQVMALGKGYDHALRGFATQDLAHRL